jgi:CDGSH-type Zn-finger protein
MFEPCTAAVSLLSFDKPAGILDMADVSIRTRENGPLLVTGPITLVDADGNQFDIAGKETVALCRCGQSQNKPFCDGQHKVCGFMAGERAVPKPAAPPQ